MTFNPERERSARSSEEPQPRVAVRVPLGLQPEQMRENTDGGQIKFSTVVGTNWQEPSYAGDPIVSGDSMVNHVDISGVGALLDFGGKEEMDSASASYGVTYFDGKTWHMFYLGTPHTSPAPDLIPAFPYLTMKAKGASPAGPWNT